MVVGADPDFPRGVVDRAVVVAAQQDEVGQAGASAECPVVDVVGVAHDRWSGAAGEGAVSVAQDQGEPDGGGDQASGAADVERFAAGAEDGGDDLGVAGQPPDRGGGELDPVTGGGPCDGTGDAGGGEPALQSLEGGGDGEPGG